jgi:hypothetical protein
VREIIKEVELLDPQFDKSVIMSFDAPVGFRIAPHLFLIVRALFPGFYGQGVDDCHQRFARRTVFHDHDYTLEGIGKT